MKTIHDTWSSDLKDVSLYSKENQPIFEAFHNSELASTKDFNLYLNEWVVISCRSEVLVN